MAKKMGRFSGNKIGNNTSKDVPSNTNQKDEEIQPVNQFDLLKNKIFQFKITAVFMFLFLIITNMKELSEVYYYYFPKVVISLKFNEISQKSALGQTTKLKVTINAISESQFSIDDAILVIEAFKVDSTITKVDLSKTFIGEFKNVINILDNSTNRVSKEIEFQSREVGEFMFVAHVKSSVGKFANPDTCFVSFISDFENKLKLLELDNHPTFMIRDSMVDIFPKRFADLEVFKVIFFDKMSFNDDVLKSTVWFVASYIGSLGGFGYEVWKIDKALSNSENRILDYLKEEYTDDGKVMYDYINNLENSAIVPIGYKFYEIQFFEGKFTAKKINYMSDTLFQGKWCDKYGETKNWVSPDKLVKFSTSVDYGATGRNESHRLKVKDTSYSYSEGEETSTDFPVYILDETDGNVTYYRFSTIGYDSLLLERIKINEHPF